MIAFVLSGGGTRGALEVGALNALLEAGIRPDILVGSSAGALNAIGLAPNPTVEGLRRLVDTWIGARREDIFPGNALTNAWRLLRGEDSLYPNDGLRRFVKANLPAGVERFGDITAVRLYLIAANINTATLYLFGEDPSGVLVDAALASAAIPPYFPPLVFGEWQYVDGGAVANVPISVAIDRGATEIYAINVGLAGEVVQKVRGVMPIASLTIQTLMYQQLLEDLEDVKQFPAVTLHHIRLAQFGDVALTDFSKTAAMIDEGYRATREYLRAPAAQRVTPEQVREAVAPAPPPPGARIWRPTRRP